MKRTYPSLPEIIIVLYCIYEAAGLLGTWQTIAPLERLGWLAFLIWVSPIVFFWTVRPSWSFDKPASSPLLILTGLVITFLGTAGSLNALHHAGLAFALAGMVPPSWKLWLWIPFSITWTPTFGWIGSRLFPEILPFMRLGLATIGTVWAFVVIYVLKESSDHEKVN